MGDVLYPPNVIISCPYCYAIFRSCSFVADSSFRLIELILELEFYPLELIADFNFYLESSSVERERGIICSYREDILLP